MTSCALFDVFRFICPVLLVAGQHSVFNDTTHGLQQAIIKTCEDKTKVEFVDIVEVANVLQEKVNCCHLNKHFKYWLTSCSLLRILALRRDSFTLIPGGAVH
jgi:hypothetical protein